MRPTAFWLPFLAVMLLKCFIPAFSQQEKKSGKKKVYIAIVGVTYQRKKMEGVLQEVGDSSIYVLTKKGMILIESKVIKEIAIKRKGSAGWGALTGSLVGMGLGAIIGFASGDDQCDGTAFCITFTAEEKALGGAIALGGVGALIGMGAGSTAKEHIKIGESQSVFSTYIELLRKYSMHETL